MVKPNMKRFDKPNADVVGSGFQSAIGKFTESEVSYWEFRHAIRFALIIASVMMLIALEGK